MAPEIVHHHDPAPTPRLIDNRHAEPERRLNRCSDTVLFDVEIERRNIDLARRQFHRVDEEVALRLVLQPLQGNDERLVLDVVDADTLHSALVDPAQLVIDPETRGKRHQIGREVGKRRRIVLVERPGKARQAGNQPDIAGNHPDVAGQ